MQHPEAHVISPQSIKRYDTREQRDDGIVPINVLLEKLNPSNCVKRPISVGIVDVKALLVKDKYVNCVNRPISVGIVDVKALS